VQCLLAVAENAPPIKSYPKSRAIYFLFLPVVKVDISLFGWFHKFFSAKSAFFTAFFFAQWVISAPFCT